MCGCGVGGCITGQWRVSTDRHTGCLTHIHSTRGLCGPSSRPAAPHCVRLCKVRVEQGLGRRKHLRCSPEWSTVHVSFVVDGRITYLEFVRTSKGGKRASVCWLACSCWSLFGGSELSLQVGASEDICQGPCHPACVEMHAGLSHIHLVCLVVLCCAVQCCLPQGAPV